MTIKKIPEKFGQGKARKTFFGIPIPHRYVMYDKLHYGTVFVLSSFAAITFLRLIVQTANYYSTIKPLLKEKGRLLKELEMRAMQQEKEAELNQEQSQGQTQANLQEQLQAEADKIK